MNTTFDQILAALSNNWALPDYPSLDWDLSAIDAAIPESFAIDWHEFREAVSRLAERGGRIHATGLALWMIRRPFKDAQLLGSALLFGLADDAQDFERQFAMVIHCQCLFYGVGTPQDFGRGIHSLLKVHCRASSDEILAPTFTLLGDVWAKGLIGGVVDHELAQDYYRVAVEEYEFTAGPYGAGVFWDPTPIKGTPQAKIADADLAAEYYSMAAEAGNAAAAFKLSMLMATGKIRPAPREDE